MALFRYMLAAPIILALALGGGGMHAVLDASGGCGHEHALVDASTSRDSGGSGPRCCGHDHCSEAGPDAEHDADPRTPAERHDDSGCVVCVWAASGAIYQFHVVGVCVSEALPAPHPSDYRYESRSTLTPLSRGPPVA